MAAANLAYLHKSDEADSAALEDELTPGEMPPYSTDAEQAVLCAVLQDADAMAEAAPLLKPDYFFHEHHRIIYSACLELFKAGERVDILIVSEMLKDDSRLWDVGGRSYLMDLASGFPASTGFVTSNSVRYWAKRVKDMAQRRAVWQAGYELIETASDTRKPDYMETATASLMAIAQEYDPETETTANTALDEAFQRLYERATNPLGVVGLPTGIRSLDKMTGGFQPGQLITLGARPGNGKTSLALNICDHVIRQTGRPVLFFSLEMMAAELLARVVKTAAGSSSDLHKLAAARDELRPMAPLWQIEDAGGLSFPAIQARALRQYAKRPETALIVVDHLGLIVSEDSKRFQNRAYELGVMTAGLKTLAKTLKTPILLLCQLNRAIESRQDRKPQLSDLRDSGSIEQDSDIVLFLEIERDKDRKPTSKATLSLAKQRDNPQCEIPLTFIPFLTKFMEPIGVVPHA